MLLISSGDWCPLRAPTLCPLALTGTPPEPLSLGQPLPLSGVAPVRSRTVTAAVGRSRVQS